MRTQSLLALFLLLLPTSALAQQQSEETQTPPAAEMPPPETEPESQEVPTVKPTGPASEEAVAPKAETQEPTTATAEEVREYMPEEAMALEEKPRAAPWSPYIDTRLTFVFADDNVLAGPGETLEASPGPQFRATGANNLFFENYDTKYTGFETLTNLVLYKQTPTFFNGLVGEAGLVLTLLVNPDDRKGITTLQDSSSYVRLVYHPEGWNDAENISFTGFPVRSDRFRLGYSYRLTWGGDSIFPQAKASVPGARFQITRDNWYAWVGGKTTVLDETVFLQAEQATEEVANYGALTGFGVDLTENLALDFGAGFFTRGTFPVTGLQGDKIYSGGGSVQLAWHVGRPVGQSIDLRLYKNDPMVHQTFFRPEKYGTGVDWVVKSEFTWLAQTLADPTAPGSTTVQNARAGDVNFAMKFGLNRLFLDGVYQDLAFLLFNVPSFVPYQDFTAQMQPNPEMFVALGYDRYIESLHLTPGIRFGVQRPAYVVTDRLPVGTNPPVELAGERVVVVRNAFRKDVLPPGNEVLPIYALQGTARLDLAETMAILAEISFEVDNNRATFAQLASGERVPVFEDPYILGYNIVLQSRF